MRLSENLDKSVHALIDTGAILAILSKRDRWHSSCISSFRQLRVPLLTSEAVLTELFHLIRGNRIGLESAWRLVLGGSVVLAPIGDEELPAIRALMLDYADLPMDFADATLVYLAKRESISTILTIDFSDFAIYRIEGKRPFQVLPPGRN